MKSLFLSGVALAAFTVCNAANAETIFVSNEKDNTLAVVDGETLEVTDIIEVGRRPRGITFNHDHTQIYVCAGDDNRIDVVDIASRKVVDSLPSGPTPSCSSCIPRGASSMSPTRTTTWSLRWTPRRP